MTTIGLGRVAVLLDLENLLYPVDAPQQRGARLRALMSAVAALGPVQSAVGCCDRWLARAVYATARDLGVRVFPGPIGPDRADAELLRRAADIPASAEAVVIASGDHAFAPLAAAQRAAGRTVLVAAVEGSLSRVLAAEADLLLTLPAAGGPAALAVQIDAAARPAVWEAAA